MFKILVKWQLSVAVLSAIAMLFAVPFAAAGMKTVSIANAQVNVALEAKIKNTFLAKDLESVAKFLPSALEASLGKFNKFTLVNRTRRGELLAEQDFAESGNVDTSQSNAPASGRLLGASLILLPEIVSFSDDQKYVQRGTMKEIARVTTLVIRAQLTDATTGAVVGSTEVWLEKENSTNKDFIFDVTTAAANQVSLRIIDDLFPAKVVAKLGRTITLNRGNLYGISVGDKYDIYALGGKITDPDTGKYLGQQEVDVGKIEIKKVMNELSTGELVGEDLGVVEGAILRRSANK